MEGGTKKCQTPFRTKKRVTTLEAELPIGSRADRATRDLRGHVLLRAPAPPVLRVRRVPGVSVRERLRFRARWAEVADGCALRDDEHRDLRQEPTVGFSARLQRAM